MADITLDGVDGIFTRWGKIGHVLNIINTFVGTTLDTEVEDVLEEYDGQSTDVRDTLDGVLTAFQSSQSSFGTLKSRLKTAAEQTLLVMVEASEPGTVQTITVGLGVLFTQMDSNSKTLDAAIPTVAVADVGTPLGDGVVVATITGGDGRDQENCLAETIDCEINSSGNLVLTGEVSVTDKLSHDWPAGSGVSVNLTPTATSGGLLTNGDFDTQANRANSPDSWVVDGTGTIGTDLKITVYEVQTVVISGTPTSGTFTLQWTDRVGLVQETIPIAYNATGAAVQSALRSLAGLELVTNVQTGTTPNFTNTITFTGVAGNVSQLVVRNNLTGQTVTAATTTAGTTEAYTGAAAWWADPDNTLTAISQRITVSPNTRYAFSCRMLAGTADPTTGEMAIELIDGLGGNVIGSDQAVDEVQSITVDATGGTFTVTFDGEGPTSAIAFDVTAAALKTALETLDTIDNVTVTGGPGDSGGTTPYVVTFKGKRAGESLALMTTNAASLTGGASTAVVAQTTDGSGGNRIVVTVASDLVPKDVWYTISGVFITPKVIPDVVYLRIHNRSNIDGASPTDIYVDHAALVAMTELYSGGPAVAVFSGRDEFEFGDAYSVTVTNARAGALQELLDKLFDTAGKDLKAPSAASGNVADSLIG